MGVLAPVSAQRDTPLSPPSTSAEIFRRTCLHSNLQISPPTPKNAYAKFQNPKTTLGILVKVIPDCEVNPTGQGYPRLCSKSYWSRLSQTV